MKIREVINQLENLAKELPDGEETYVSLHTQGLTYEVDEIAYDKNSLDVFIYGV